MAPSTFTLSCTADFRMPGGPSFPKTNSIISRYSAIKESVLEATVTVPGSVESQSGGKLDGSTVSFSIPLIRVLLLEEPLDYSIIYR